MTPKQLVKKWGKRVVRWALANSEAFQTFYYPLQRAIYGYSEQDVYGMDYWLCEVIPPAIDELISRQVGCPSDFLDNRGIDATEEDIAEGIKKWEAVMLQIKEGFQAWGNAGENNWRMSAEEEKAAKRKFRRGMILMARYFHTMWW